LLIEEARTNSIRNNTMQGAVAGTPGTLPTNWATQFNTTTGLTREIVGTGTENGITYIDIRVSGTSVGAGSFDVFLDGASAIAALTGQTWTASVYLKLQAGSTNGLSTLQFRGYQYTSGIAFVASSNFFSGGFPTSAALNTQRFNGAATLAGGATVAYVRPLIAFNIADATAIDITLRIGLPQLELGAFATSVIPTTTTALTRNADVASMTGTNFSSWYNASEGTLYVEAQLQGVGGLAPAALVSIDDVTTNNRIILRRSLVAGTANFRFVSSAGSIDANLLSGSNTGLNKMIAAFKAGDQQSANNGTLFTGITPVASLPIVTRLAIGDGPGSTPASGTIRRIAYYPVRLASSQLQALTA
jgi:hypothetical protein